MKNPIHATIIFALVSGVLMLPFIGLMHGWVGFQTTLKCFLWMDLALYLLLLAQRSRSRSLSILFPLALLLTMVFWPVSWVEFLVPALGVLCWVRSGICYDHAPLRALAAEPITIVGGIILVGLIGSDATCTWPIGLCLFILVQALYFFIVPMDRTQKIKGSFSDPFEQARYAAEKVLR